MFIQLELFLEDYERGSLVVNAETFDVQNPTFDWLSYEDAVQTRDKRLQESIGFYDPAVHVIVFVFLPSASGNSAAVWRQKIEIPENVRTAYGRAIRRSPKAAVKKTVIVDEITYGFISSIPLLQINFSLLFYRSPPPKKKKGFFKRFFRAFKIFKIQW
jgi:hypothetical protein